MAAYTASKEKKKKWKGVYFLPLIGVLSMGYGENSWLRKVCGGKDWITRIVYGLLLAIPFLFFAKWYALIALPIAFSIRAGAFEIGWGKQFLWEDFFRYSTLGVLVVL